MKKLNTSLLYSVILNSIIILFFVGCTSIVDPPMHAAVRDGDIKTVERLLKDGIDVDEWSECKCENNWRMDSSLGCSVIKEKGFVQKFKQFENALSAAN